MNNTSISNAYKSHFNFNQHAYYFPPPAPHPFCDVFAYVSSLRSQDKGIFYGVYIMLRLI